ncbi:MAG: helix-turn-helix transcriptional regulator [Anaerolineae bacterium]|nr:helix-turn-helix transcriptional regulator [Anaerolineae bacterium]
MDHPMVKRMGQRRLPQEYVLLGFLFQGEMHGYDLHQRVEEALSRIWYVGMSNLYAALKRLEEAGHVAATLMPQETYPARKVYHITPTGRERFLEWVREPLPSMRDMRVEFPAKLYFFRSLGLEGEDELIAAQEAVCRERLEQLESGARAIPPNDFNHLVFDFRRRQIEAILDWLAACRR